MSKISSAIRRLKQRSKLPTGDRVIQYHKQASLVPRQGSPGALALGGIGPIVLMLISFFGAYCV